MLKFNNYNDVIFDAFCLYSKKKELIERKKDIISKVRDHYNIGTGSVLFVGFNPAILNCNSDEIYVTQVSDRVYDWLVDQNANIKLHQDQNRKFDIVIACDEYLTFAETEEEQKQMIASLCDVSNKLLVTTVKDYKNQDFKDREYSQPVIIKSSNATTAFTEIHNWNYVDKSAWTTSVYELAGADTKFRGNYARRTLFFKQLAKFSLDAGADTFLVHKNLMYKSLIKKNYEHVISVFFE